MKKVLLIATILIILMAPFSFITSAQGMMNWVDNSSTIPSLISVTAQDEAKGKQIWDQLRAKQISCNNLKDNDYEILGEYFMGQSIGNTEIHAAMNQMMKSMMTENGEDQMHITLGKRSSGCDMNASFPSRYGLPMIGWMMGGGGNSMMNCWASSGFFGWIFMVILWVLIILSIVALVRYLIGQYNVKSKSPLEILKERYAKGEINKKEFDQMKKDFV